MTGDDLRSVHAIAKSHWPNRQKIAEALTERLIKVKEKTPGIDANLFIRMACRIGVEMNRTSTIGYVSQKYAAIVKEFGLDTLDGV